MPELDTLAGVNIPAVTDNLDSIPESLRAIYIKGTDGKYTINSQPATDMAAELKHQEQLRKFRDQNIALMQEKKTLQEKMDKFDSLQMTPEEVVDLKQKMVDFKEKDLLNKNEFEEYAKSRTEEMRKAHDKAMSDMRKQLETASKYADKYKASLQENTLRSSVLENAHTSNPLRENAIPDVLARAAAVWKMDESQTLYADDGAGGRKAGKEGQDLTMGEWLEALADEAPHLFEQSTAGGVQQPNTIGGGVKTNGATRWVDGNDMYALGKHADAIAKGEMDVR